MSEVVVLRCLDGLLRLARTGAGFAPVPAAGPRAINLLSLLLCGGRRVKLSTKQSVGSLRCYARRLSPFYIYSYQSAFAELVCGTVSGGLSGFLLKLFLNDGVGSGRLPTLL